MKLNRLLKYALCMCLALLLFAAPALAANAIYTIGDFKYNFSIGGATVCGENTPDEALIIPKQVEYGDDEYLVRACTADAFIGNKVQYIKLEHNDVKNMVGQVPTGAFDFSFANDLKAVYVNFDVTDEVQERFVLPDNGSEILQYVNLSSESIAISPAVYSDGAINLYFNDVIYNYPGYGYKVTRREANSSAPEIVFDSAADTDAFMIQDGTVRFIDPTVEVGMDYLYVVTAYEPFGTSTTSEVSVTIPLPEVVPETDDGTDDDAAVLPETGDGANLVLWTTLLAASIIGLTVMLRRRFDAA